MGYVIHIDGDTGGGGGSGTGWDGQVEFRANLPITLGSPAIGSIYLVEKKTTLLGFTTYQSGLYIRDTNLGALSDWRRLNVKVNFTDSEFAIVSSADNSKKAKFDLSLVTTSTTRTYIYPDKNGTIALLSDVVLQGLPSVLGQDNSTGTSDIDMTSGTALTESTTGAYLDLKDTTGAFGTGTYLNGEEAFVFLSDLDMYISTGVPFINPYTAAVQGSQDGLVLSLIGFPKYGTITIANNDSADFTSINLEQYCAIVCSKNSTAKQNIIGSIAVGGADIIMKTNYSAYVNQIAYNTGLAGELTVNHTPSATDYTQTHQAKTGTIALLSDVLSDSKIACCPFGAKSDSIGDFLIANGKSSDADDSSKPKTRQPIGLDGTLTKLVYKTKDGDTTTQMKIHVNGVVEETVVLSSMNANSGGVETISVSVSAGDYVEIEYDGSQKPGECTMYFIQEL